jgi:hypothetical protein
MWLRRSMKAMHPSTVAAVVLTLLVLPRGDTAAQEISEAASKIAATQNLLDSFIYEKTTGTIENIDLSRNTFQIEGKTFTASPTDTVGVKLSELKEGDKIRVEATDVETARQPIDVMILRKAE